MFFLFMLKKKCVGPVKTLGDQYILGVTGPTGPVTLRVSVDSCGLSKISPSNVFERLHLSE